MSTEAISLTPEERGKFAAWLDEQATAKEAWHDDMLESNLFGTVFMASSQAAFIRTLAKVLRKLGAAESQANARLRAAAPELLEALQVVLKGLEEYERADDQLTLSEVAPLMVPMAEAAIRKATEGK